MSNVKEIELDKLTAAHQDNIKEVYRVIGLLLKSGENAVAQDDETITEEQAEDVIKSLDKIKIRDGILSYSITMPSDMRNDLMKGLTLYTTAAAKFKLDEELIGNATMIIAAVLFAHAGAKLIVDSNEDVSVEVELFESLIEDANRLCTRSLLSLLTVAASHGIPATVWYESLEAVSVEESTNPLSGM